MHPQKLIGLLGKRGSGKDTAAQALVPIGFKPVRFAGAMKEMLRAYLLYVGESEITIGEMLEGALKEVSTPSLGGKSPRSALQTLGTQWGRELVSPNLWVNACLDRYAHCDKVVVTDVRVAEEVTALKKIGGKIIRIKPPGTETDDAHDTERDVDKLRADFEVINDGTIDDLHAKVLQIVNVLN